MVVLEAIGLAAGEIFDYNRENFKWDQERRFQKDETRIGMQIERFDLFREDIEDLVNLTVGKMDMYHGVGEIFLAFSLTLYTEGRVSNHAPNFYTSIYFFSVACAWIYILLAVWLAVYASITAHSFGVRIRTRYVRLPIPSAAHINRLTARGADFERQGIQDMMRVPFSTQGAPQWQWQFDQQNSAKRNLAASWNVKKKAGPDYSGAEGELLGQGEAAFGKVDVLNAAANIPGKHVQLYRRLSAKWQCFDAYARVSMALGVNNLLQAVNFFVIGITFVDTRSPSCGYALTLIFQACRLALGYLDIAGMHKRTVTAVQVLGTLPVILVLVAMEDHHEEREDGSSIIFSVCSCLAFYLMALWTECLIYVARPSNDEASLPLAYRSVLFLDVFGDSSYDPTEGEHKAISADDAHSRSREAQERRAAQTEFALGTAQAALRRWEAAPSEVLSKAQRNNLKVLRQEYSVWRKTYQGQQVTQKGARNVPSNPSLRDAHDLRPWAELTFEERQDDEFSQALIGPLPNGNYYHLEKEKDVPKPSPQQRVLTIEEIQAHIRNAKEAVRLLTTDSGAEVTEIANAQRAQSQETLPRFGSDMMRSFSKVAQKKHKVIRLPWKVVNFMSRVMQLMWLFLAVMQTLEAWQGTVIHSSEQEHFPWESLRNVKGEDEELPAARRLRDVALTLQQPGINFSRVAVAWPHGAFFHPESLSHAFGPAGNELLMVGSPYLLYRMGSLTDEPLPVKAMPGGGPPRAVHLCARKQQNATDAPCLRAYLEKGGVAFEPLQDGPKATKPVVLPVQGRPWQLLAGTVLHCSEVSGYMLQEEAPEWCALLAGWDGHRIPLAAVALPAGPAGVPSPTATVASRFDVPASPPRGSRGCGPAASASCRRPEQKRARRALGAHLPAKDDGELVALHLEPGGGRLWALFAGGGLHAWDVLIGRRRLGQWQGLWSHVVGDAGLEVTAFCTGAQALWLAGVSGERSRPELLRAPLLEEFL